MVISLLKALPFWIFAFLISYSFVEFGIPLAEKRSMGNKNMQVYSTKVIHSLVCSNMLFTRLRRLTGAQRLVLSMLLTAATSHTYQITSYVWKFISVELDNTTILNNVTPKLGLYFVEDKKEMIRDKLLL